jgi:RNA polymerase sigma-70 factor (ECF subfamily)
MDPRSEPSDAGLLEAARRGDAKSLEKLLERHQDQVYRFGMKMCRDPEDARDVLQDTLLAMARSVRDFRGKSSISTWLYSIARGFCIKKRRRSKFAPAAERSLESESIAEASALADPARSPDEQLAGKEVRQALERAVGELEPMYREVLVLRDVEGLSALEVAEVLGLGVPAVKSRLHRARASVRERVAPLLGIPVLPAAAQRGGCPDVLDLLSRHLEGEISAGVCAEMERHVAACGRCRGACESLKRTLALCRTSPSAPVPDEVQQSVRAAVRKFLGRSS